MDAALTSRDGPHVNNALSLCRVSRRVHFRPRS
jgi:hypothetical protein